MDDETKREIAELRKDLQKLRADHEAFKKGTLEWAGSVAGYEPHEVEAMLRKARKGKK